MKIRRVVRGVCGHLTYSLPFLVGVRANSEEASYLTLTNNFTDAARCVCAPQWPHSNGNLLRRFCVTRKGLRKDGNVLDHTRNVRMQRTPTRVYVGTARVETLRTVNFTNGFVTATASWLQVRVGQRKGH